MLLLVAWRLVAAVPALVPRTWFFDVGQPLGLRRPLRPAPDLHSSLALSSAQPSAPVLYLEYIAPYFLP